MKTCYGNLFSAISTLFVASIIVMLMISGCFRSFTSFSGSTLQYSGSIEVIQLNRNITISDRVQTIHSVRSSLSFQLNRTVTRKFAKVIRREDEHEQGLARARASIRRAASGLNLSSIADSHHKSDIDSTAIYHNARAFYRSYLEMEKRFKVYVYSEGELPIVHDGPCKDIYTIEGRFIHEIEHGARRFKTNSPHNAHVYFMPFSVTWMVKYLYKPLTYNLTPLRQFVSDYVRVVSSKYPFWNRTQGADHFMLACHDWGPHASQGNPDLYSKSIRVLCNANTSEGFNPQKDVSLPEIHLYGGEVSPKLLSPPPAAADSPRLHLAFFAGGIHGPIRPLLLQHWKDSDPELLVHEYLPKDLDYYSLMLQSKFCLCPSGHEVASPRIVEAIYAECVPVILSQNYVLPFSDVLRWEAFSIRVDVSEIPRLKEVLTAVSEEKYRRLKEGLRAVRKHFVLNQPSKPFDVFHMILHSVWLRRINLRRQ
ncbi:exostosin family protein [Tripterygium wilfordii]|uniref:Exostosin family protein n=1 Tax=Tripterygium wilfordii TaxID=458696 RepID=A0A7J7DQ02_TRIWF|nr:probable glycosyltransferase At5g25310 [Tripterygium wilfordii]KAF5748166.1 exostosin family protein [Tripterygium wilfordii]